MVRAVSYAELSVAHWSPSLKQATIDGRRMQYLDVGTGEPLVLIHGIGCSWVHWIANLDALSAKYRVIAVDLPGFGGSDPVPEGTDLTETSGSVLKLLEQLGIDKAIVAGHSLGGIVSWLIALAAPEKVERLVLVDAGTVVLPAWATAMIVRQFGLLVAALGNPAIARALLRRPRVRNAFLRGLTKHPRRVPLDVAVALVQTFIGPPGFRAALQTAPAAVTGIIPDAMGIKSLLIWGTLDPIFPVSTARVLHSEMPDAQLVEIRGAGHCPQFERPEEFNRALLEWLAPPV